jgi:hypothetical protein
MNDHLNRYCEKNKCKTFYFNVRGEVGRGFYFFIIVHDVSFVSVQRERLKHTIVEFYEGQTIHWPKEKITKRKGLRGLW